MLVLELQWQAIVRCRSCPVSSIAITASYLVLFKNSQTTKMPIKSKLMSLMFELYHHSGTNTHFQSISHLQLFIKRYSKLSYSISFNMQFHIREMCLPWHNHISKYPNSTHSLKLSSRINSSSNLCLLLNSFNNTKCPS